jgi:hypothetical protein
MLLFSLFPAHDHLHVSQRCVSITLPEAHLGPRRQSTSGTAPAARRPAADTVARHGRLKIVVHRGTDLHGLDLLSTMNPYVTAVLIGPPGTPRVQGSTLPSLGGDKNPKWQGDTGVGACVGPFAGLCVSVCGRM